MKKENDTTSNTTSSTTVGRPTYTKDGEDFSPAKVLFETINKTPQTPKKDESKK